MRPETPGERVRNRWARSAHVPDETNYRYDNNEPYRYDNNEPRPGPGGERSLGELFGTLTSDLSELMRSEMELARVELKEEATKAGKAGKACSVPARWPATWP